MLRATRRALVLTLAAVGVGKLIARSQTRGDAASDVFSLMVVCGGAQRKSTATALREGTLRVVCGGIQLDLRKARLDPGGATLRAPVVFGGLQVIVPDGWRVAVEAGSIAGGIDTRTLPPPDALPADAPTLRVTLRVVMGGAQVLMRPPREPAPSDG